MSLNWVDCDLPAPEERTPEQIRKSVPPASPYRGLSKLLILICSPLSPEWLSSRQFPVFFDEGGHLAFAGDAWINVIVELQHGARSGQENPRVERSD